MTTAVLAMFFLGFNILHPLDLEVVSHCFSASSRIKCIGQDPYKTLCAKIGIADLRLAGLVKDDHEGLFAP